MSNPLNKPVVNNLSDMVRKSIAGIDASRIPNDESNQIIIESDARTPHQSQWVGICLEIAAKRSSSFKQFFWTTMANRIKSAQQFQFGEVEDTKIKSEAARSGPLIAQEFLSLPYQSVIYNYTLIPDPRDVPEEMWKERVKFSSLACIIEKDMLKDPLPGPLILAADFLFVPPDSLFAKKKYCMILAAGIAFQANAPEFKWKGQIVDEPGEARRTSLVSVADGIGALSMMLATRGIQSKTRTPPNKLQKARVKRGKSLLPTVTHVNTQRYYQAIENVEKGHHASPVPHLRRGHIRRLGEDRQVWIQDTIVNCRTLDEASKARDHYEVKVAEDREEKSDSNV